ncbi:MAG: ammonium transporter [Alphaproteobacteria bacterium]|nr:ammonium transporter [Alphaproteobacteria bacterium]
MRIPAISRMAPVAAACLLLTSLPAWSQAAAAAPVAPDAANTAWVLTATALVLMMTIPGLALFYGGLVRKMNVLATLMHSFAACCVISVLWVVAGYSLAFSGDGAVIGDLSRLFLRGMAMDQVYPATTVSEPVYMMFQMTFAIITPALIAGAFVDRIKFSAAILFMAAWMMIVYVPLAHWVWGGGFLQKAGVLDFAGGIVVHISAGVAALVVAVVIGPRRGYGKEALPPHNLVYSLIGISLLWVGWFGFNGGSALTADGRAGLAITATHIAAAAGGCMWAAVEWWLRGKPSMLGAISGAVAGLGTITPASGFVTPGGALIIGLIAGGACYWACIWLKNRLGYDDSLDVFGVHGVGGAIGTLLLGVFAAKVVGGTAGLLEGDSAQLWLQVYGVAVAIAYDVIATLIIIKVIDVMVGLRVTADEEREGLDLTLHGETVP